MATTCSALGCHDTADIQSVWERYCFWFCSSQCRHCQNTQLRPLIRAYITTACSTRRWDAESNPCEPAGPLQCSHAASTIQSGMLTVSWRTGARESHTCSARSEPPNAMTLPPSGAAAMPYTALFPLKVSTLTPVSASHCRTCSQISNQLTY